MLSTPYEGWSTITIGEFTYSISDIGDTPIDWLTSCICFLRYRIPLTLFFEGALVTFIYNFNNSYIIEEKENRKCIEFIPKYELGWDYIPKEIASDIKRDIDKWKWWGVFEEYNDEQAEKNKQHMLKLIEEIERLLNRKSFGSYIPEENIL